VQGSDEHPSTNLKRKKGRIVKSNVQKRQSGHTKSVTLLWLLLTLISINAWAERPKVGLVLGGGGARGAAHVGVLKVLERENIPIDYIAGTSMGAVIGALYASGRSASEIEAILESLDWHLALSDRGMRSEHSIRSKKNDVEFAISAEAGFKQGKIDFPTGLLQGQQLELILRRLFLDVAEVKNFDNLTIPFRAVATDLATMQAKVFDSGDLTTAVRASMSVPGAFEPVAFEDTLLVDGGIVDNVPADVARAMGADVLIIVDVRTPLSPASELDSIGAVLNQVINGMMAAETDRELGALGPNDVLIQPDLRDLSSADFPRSPEAVPWGEEAALAHLPQLRNLSLSSEEYSAVSAERPDRPTDIPQISRVTAEYATADTQKTVSAMLSWQEGNPLDVDRLESGIAQLYSDGSYSTIQYELVPQGDETDLQIELTDKAWGPTIVEAALRVSDNFNGVSNYLFSVETLTNNVNSKGAKWINRARMGLRTGLFSEFYQPISANHRNFIAPSVEYAARNVSIRSTTDQTLWRDQRGILALDAGHAFGSDAEIRIGYELGMADTRLLVGDTIIDANLNFTISQVTAEYLRDTLDDSAFPSKGLFLDVKVNLPVESLGADATSPAYFLDIYKPVSTKAGTFLFGLSANGATDEDLVFQETLSLGGITRLSGYQPDELFGFYTGLANIVYYRRLGKDRNSLFGTPIYFGGSIEAGGVWFARDEINTQTLQAAGSLFAGIDSPIGPIYLAYGHAEGGVNSIYLNIGSLFRRLPRR
jgi:NTE family protein